MDILSLPGGVLAHSTHLKGMGTFDPIKGEQARIGVTLATGISAERVLLIIKLSRFRLPLDPQNGGPVRMKGIPLVPKAGEILYRLI